MMPASGGPVPLSPAAPTSPGNLPRAASMYIFDFCGTLLGTGSTFRFLSFFHREASIRKQCRHLCLWITASLLRRLGLIRPTGYTRMRLRSLAGFHRDTLEAAAARWVHAATASHFERNPARQMLTAAQNSGKPVVLASYTLDILLNAFAAHTHVDVIVSSELAFTPDGVCCGTMLKEVETQGKLAALRDQFTPSMLRDACFITDDAEADRDLFAYVRFPQQMPAAIPIRKVSRGYIRALLETSPARYYYATRYTQPHQRVAHVLKYWMPYLLLLWLMTPTVTVCLPAILIAWIAYLSLYDIFCRSNDEVSAQGEQSPTHRPYDSTLSRSAFAAIKGIWILAMLALYLTQTSIFGAAALALLLLATAAIFQWHNTLPPRFRPATLFLLYLSKALVPILPIAISLSGNDLRLYAAYAILFNATYLPGYFAKKRQTQARAPQDNPVWRDSAKTIWQKPILLKNAVVALLACFEVQFLILLVWIDGITLVEGLLDYRRRQS